MVTAVVAICFTISGLGMSVLVSVGLEFMFFTVASTELCFGFVLNRELITSRFFCYC